MEARKGLLTIEKLSDQNIYSLQVEKPYLNQNSSQNPVSLTFYLQPHLQCQQRGLPKDQTKSVALMPHSCRIESELLGSPCSVNLKEDYLRATLRIKILLTKDMVIF